MHEIQQNGWVPATDADAEKKTMRRRGINGKDWPWCLIGCALGSIICGIALGTIVVVFVQGIRQLISFVHNSIDFLDHPLRLDSKRVTISKTNASSTSSEQHVLETMID